jgi:hypothetical protein
VLIRPNPSLESTRIITTSYLATLEQQRLGFGDVFAADQAAAA